MFQFNTMEKRIEAMFSADPDPINKLRVKFLARALLAYMALAAFTAPVFYYNDLQLLGGRSLIALCFLTVFLAFMVYTSRWKLIAHIVCIFMTIFIWTNIFIFIQAVNVLSIQFTLLLVLVSHYILGSRYGIIYSAITVIPMILYFTFGGQNYIYLKITPTEADNLSFTVVFIFNFLSIIYLQYHFFNAFDKTIKELNFKQAEEKELNEKLKIAIIAAEASSKAKSNFLSTISHELRTPLNAVIGMSDILLIDKPREDQVENLNILKFSANNLLDLINNVLDFNKIESGKIEIEQIPFPVDELLKNIHNGFRNKAQQKDLSLNILMDEEIRKLNVIGDPTRLTQILANLVENAIKFTTTGFVNISVELLELDQENVRLRFHVADSGIGIPTDKQELVFHSFTQSASSTTRKFGGTGLGLSIVRSLLKLLGSEISMKSEVYKGTTFSFEMAYRLDVSYYAENTALPEEIDISSLRILIAEDNEMNILLMRKLLATWHLQPSIVKNGLEAVKAHEEHTFDLILMDIHMPVMDGYDASIKIRTLTDPDKAGVKIIALTASVAMDAKEKVLSAGIDDFVPKPFNTKELRSKLEKVWLEISQKKQG